MRGCEGLKDVREKVVERGMKWNDGGLSRVEECVKEV